MLVTDKMYDMKKKHFQRDTVREEIYNIHIAWISVLKDGFSSGNEKDYVGMSNVNKLV